MKSIVLAWRVTCFACGRVLVEEATSYRSASGIWTQHKNAHASQSKSWAIERLVRPLVEIVQTKREGPGVDHDEEARR